MNSNKIINSSAFKEKAMYLPAHKIAKYSLIGALLGMVFSYSAFAESRYSLEEIVVSARKIEEGLQSAPIAVTALSGIQLENRGALNIIDFADFAPNVSFKSDGGNSGFAAAPRTSIRGVGQSEFVINSDPAVGIYADGVYLGRSLGSVLDLIDVERVEALRGPQGTLFGRNSTGGAINIIAKKPEVGSDQISGSAVVALGEDGYTQFKAGINIPLGHTTAIRANAFKRKRDGFIPALQYSNMDLGKEDVQGFRAAFRWQATDSLTLDLDADFSNREDGPTTIIPVVIGDLSVLETNLDGGGGPRQSGISTSVFARRFNGEGFHPPIPGDFAALGYISSDPLCGSTQEYRDTNRSCLGNAWAASRDGTNQVWFDREGNIVEPTQELDTYGYSVRLVWETENLTFTSISSWRGFEASFANGSPTPIYIATNDNEHFEQDQFSQEFNLSGSFNERVRWLAGAFYQEEDGVELVASIFPLAPPAARNDRDFLPINGLEDRNIENTSKAIYGQVSFDVTDVLELTVGARRTEEEKYVLINKTENEAGVVSSVLEGNADIEETNVLVNLSWDITDEIMAYGQFSDGFRNGGFPARTPPGSSLAFEDVLYDPEYVESIEFGVKSTLLDGRLRLNIAIFSSDYEDQQINAAILDPGTGGVSGTTRNLGDSEIKGFEIEANFVVTDNFRIDSSVGFLDTELTTINSANGEFIVQNGNNLQKTITGSSGIELPHAPEWQINLGANYSINFDSGAEIRNRIDLFYEAEQWASIDNFDLSLIPSTTKINYSATYIPGNGAWELTLGARNLTDEEDIANTFLNTGPGVGLYHIHTRGREAYLQFKYSFGE